MPESYFRLSARDKADALNAASAVSGRPPHLLEKDIWVVWSLAVLFESQFGSHLVFKGGTALSKAYNVIRRFSEDRSHLRYPSLGTAVGWQCAGRNRRHSTEPKPGEEVVRWNPPRASSSVATRPRTSGRRRGVDGFRICHEPSH